MLKGLLASLALFVWSGGIERDVTPFDFFFSLVIAIGPFLMNVVFNSGSDRDMADWEEPALEFLVGLLVTLGFGACFGFGVATISLYIFGNLPVSIGGVVRMEGWVLGLSAAATLMFLLTLLMIKIKKLLLS